MFRTLRALFARRSPASSRPRRCRPQVEALEERAVPTLDVLGYQGFTATEGQAVTGPLAAFYFPGAYPGSRSPSDYQVSIVYGDGTPTESGYLEGGAGYFQVFGEGHAYPHWTAPNEGVPDYTVNIYVTDLHPVAGEDPVTHFQGSVAVYPAATYVTTRTVVGTVGESFSGQVATVDLPNADKITSPLQATVIWNDGDVTSTANGRASMQRLGGDEFALVVTGHTFQGLYAIPSYPPGYNGPGYDGPEPYGFSVYVSTRPQGMQGGPYSHATGKASVVVMFPAETDSPGSASGPASEQPHAPPPPPPVHHRPGGHHRPHHAVRHTAHHPAPHAHPVHSGRGDFTFMGHDGSTFDQHGHPIHRADPGRAEFTFMGSDGSTFDQNGHRIQHTPSVDHLRSFVRRTLEMVNPEAQQNEEDLKNALGDFVGAFMR